MKITASKIVLGASFLAIQNSASAQNPPPSMSVDQLVGRQNVVTSAVPFLTISPDSRSAGMGDVGVALFNHDASAVFWNSSRLAFAKKKAGFNLSYAPWLRQLVPDVSYQSLYGYGKIQDGRGAFGGSLRFFSLGNINFTDNQGQSLGSFNPSEFAVDLCYATQLSKKFSMGMNLKFIYSNLTGARSASGQSTKAGIAGAADINGFYFDKFKASGRDYEWAFGFNFSNIGNKISYGNQLSEDFLPMNMRIGGSIKSDIDKFNTVIFALDINKLLVPTYPVWMKSRVNTLEDSIDANGNKIVEFGRDPDQPVASALFGSFADAPGGFREELKEYMISTGIEYWYDNQFVARAGFFYESPTKGNRKYATIGAGLRYKVFGLDIAYLIPFQQRHPLQNTVRFTLLFDLDAFKKSDSAQ